jgi:hypothetical protein
MPIDGWNGRFQCVGGFELRLSISLKKEIIDRIRPPSQDGD